MKKLAAIIKKARPIGLAFALLMPLFACQNGNAPTETPEPTAIVTEQPTIAPTSDTEERKRAEVEARVRKYCELVQPDEDEQRQYEQAGLKVEAIAEGRDLVYVYTYLTVEYVSVSSLRESLDAMGESFKEDYLDLAAFAGDDSVRLVLRYFSASGKQLIEYVIDKDYEPAGAVTDYDPEGYESLSSLAESEYFNTLLRTSGNNNIRVSAEAEGDDTLIIKHTIRRTLTPYTLNHLRIKWERHMKEEGEASTDYMRYMIETLVPSVDADKVLIIFRLYDFSEKQVSEYCAEIRSNDL